MKLLKFTHANSKVPVQVIDSSLFSFYHSGAQGCTYLLSTGGAIIPVSETVEQVANLVQLTLTTTKGDTTNGN